MARDQLEALTLTMSADLRRFEKSMAAMAATADKRLTAVERRAVQSQQNLSRIMDGAGRGMTSALKSGLAALAPTLAAAFSTQQIIKYADSYTTLQNRLKVAGLEGQRLVQTEDALFAAANRNGVAVDAVAQLYQRASLSRKSLGATDAQLISLTDGVTAALKVQGVSAEAATGPLLQLSQAIGAGIVRAEEFNSLAEGTPIILQAAANGASKYGGDISKLRTDVLAGTVSSKQFFDMLLRGLPAVEAQATSFQMTVGQALQTLDNQLGRYIGQTDSSLSATQRMAEGIVLLANNLDVVTNVVGGLAAIIGGRYLLSLTASASATLAATAENVRYQMTLASLEARQLGVSRATVLATGATRGFTAAVAANPLGAALVAVAALAAGIYLLNQRFSEGARAAREFEEMTASGSKALAEYEKAQIAAQNASKESAAYARENAKAMREEAEAAIVAARALAAKRTQEAQTRLAAATAAVQELNKGRIGEPGEALGQVAYAAGAMRESARAREQAAEAIREQIRQEQEFARISSGINLGGGGGAPTADPKKPKRASGPTEAELAAQREMLALQREIELQRARGNDDAARAKQRELDVLNLTKQLTDAGATNAKGTAESHVAAIAAAEDAQRGLGILWEKNQKHLAELEEKNQQANDLLLDRIGFEAELARLSGDPVAIKAKERELWIEERINELIRLRPGLSREAAAQAATKERGALDAAMRQGERGDQARLMARDFVDVLASENWAEAAGRKFKEAAFDGLEDLLTQVLSQMWKGGGGAGGGGNWLSTIASVFTGGRKAATGRSATAGFPVLIGERRPEVFVPNTSGTIIPSVNAAVGRAQRAASAPSMISPVVRIDLTGANGDQTIRYLAAEAARQAYAEAVSTSSRVVPAQQAQRQRYSRGG